MTTTGSGLPTPSPTPTEAAFNAVRDWFEENDTPWIPMDDELRSLVKSVQTALGGVRAALGEPPPTNDVTRVELIDHRHGAPSVGRVFVALGCRVELSYQDGGRTLKVFVDGEASTENVRPAPPQGSAPEDVLELVRAYGGACHAVGIEGEPASERCAAAWDAIEAALARGLRPQGSEPLPRIPDDTLAALLQEAIQSPELNFPNFTYANTAAWLAARGVQVRPQGSETTTRERELLNAEQQLSDAYLRLRNKLAPWGAFNTPHAPTGEQVWSTTERALDTLFADLEKALAVRPQGEAPPSDIYERVNRHQVANEGLHELPVSMDTHLILARIRDALHEAYHLGQANDGDAFAKLDGASHRALLQAISGLRGGEAPHE